MNKEIWKDIEFDKNYKVSNTGKIYSVRSNKIINGEKTKKGYIRVALTNAKRYLVHVLVAQTFIPNPENKEQVNHIDGNKQNNCVENLEWTTQSENMKHAYKLGLQRHRKSGEIYNARAVVQLDLDNNYIREWDSISEAQQTLKINHIWSVCKNERNQCGGYKWKFKEDFYEI